MIVNSNIPQNPIWIRELQGEKRRVTLRRNFVAAVEESGETKITFEEVDVLLADSADLADHVRNNFEALFQSAVNG